MGSPYAVVSLVSSDSYLPGALAQVAALRDLHPSPATFPERDFLNVCLVTPESLDVATIKQLRRAYDLVVGVEILEQDNRAALKLLGRPDLTTVLTKLHIFRLTQFQKLIFLDADVLPIRPISHLFNLPQEFSAAPDVGWPDIFNSGVLVVTPSEENWNQLRDLIKSKPSWDGGDQGILNEWRGGDWNRLSFTYNTTPTAAYTYAPAYERFGSQISAIHFIGPNKPWKDILYRTPFVTHQSTSSESDSVQRAYNYESLVDRWFDVYDRHYRAPAAALPQASFQVQPYVSAWDQPTDSNQRPPSAETFDMEHLKRLAIEGINASVAGNHHGEGKYISLPLEGRIDLMRPRPPPSQEDQVGDAHHSQGQDPDKGNRFLSDSFSYDEGMSTPVMRPMVLDGNRWHLLPTHEAPTGLHPRIISLSSGHGFSTTTPDFYASESESENLLLNRPPSANGYHRPASANGHHRPPSANGHHRPPTNQHHHDHHDQRRHHHTDNSQTLHHYPDHLQQSHRVHTHQHGHEEHSPYHQPQPQHSHESGVINAPASTRPISPPKVAWNPAIEPPPNVQPVQNAFPLDTYFANIWDQTPGRPNDQPHSHSGPSPPHGGFFEPPPPSVIPEGLVKQGHYRNVTGESQQATPIPDRAKVKSVFPWETKPRPLPGRVFPDSDAPPPSLFLSPSSQSQTSTTTPSTPEMRTNSVGRLPVTSPLSLPNKLTYANAWDSVPSIQKYATRLAKPPAPPPSLAPAFDDDLWRKGRRKSRDDRSEVSSRDGDDEDNADDEDEEDQPAPSSSKWDDDDSDRETAKRRSRSGSIVQATLKAKKKEYRNIGVQTLITETRSQGIQTEPPKPERHAKRPSSSKRHWPPATGPVLLAPAAASRDSNLGSDLPPATIVSPRPPQRRKSSSGSQSPLRSPREFVISPPNTIRGGLKSSTPPLQKPSMRSVNSSSSFFPPPSPSVSPPVFLRTRTTSTKSSSGIIRQPSNDSSNASPVSSVGPLSPPDGHAVLSPIRTAGRVWDPARGVELFKKGSEEVLARFLKMGAFDEEVGR